MADTKARSLPGTELVLEDGWAVSPCSLLMQCDISSSQLRSFSLKYIVLMKRLKDGEYMLFGDNIYRKTQNIFSCYAIYKDTHCKVTDAQFCNIIIFFSGSWILYLCNVSECTLSVHSWTTSLRLWNLETHNVDDCKLMQTSMFVFWRRRRKCESHSANLLPSHFTLTQFSTNRIHDKT